MPVLGTVLADGYRSLQKISVKPCIKSNNSTLLDPVSYKYFVLIYKTVACNRVDKWLDLH
jgi:hypothetical protein